MVVFSHLDSDMENRETTFWSRVNWGVYENYRPKDGNNAGRVCNRQGFQDPTFQDRVALEGAELGYVALSLLGPIKHEIMSPWTPRLITSHLVIFQVLTFEKTQRIELRGIIGNEKIRVIHQILLIQVTTVVCQIYWPDPPAPLLIL
eukprot:g63755.t1